MPLTDPHSLSAPPTRQIPALPRPALPLQGLTLLAVEDSRFASEALRLLCQRSGARLRRAETLQAAARHLAVYRPDAVIVDLGMPDGDGSDLIRSLSRRGMVVLGTSGDPDGRGAALAAGAAGFLDKPPESLAAFQSAILRHFPGLAPPEVQADPPIVPDPLALRDDLLRAAQLLGATQAAAAQTYVAGFLGSVARSTRDAALEHAASEAGSPGGRRRLEALLSERLARAESGFPRAVG